MTDTSNPKRRKLSRWLIFAAGTCVIAVVALRLLGSGRAATRQAGAERPTSVNAAVAIAKTVPIQITAIGHIQPIASVDLRPQIDGQIEQVLVRDGQDVKPGDPIIQLDDRQAKAALQQAQGNLARDSAQLDFAQQEVERYDNLVKQSAGSRQQLEQAVANAGALTGTVQSDQAQVASDTVELSYTTITAPIAGRIGTIALKQGNLVHQTDTAPLATINQIAPIYVVFSIPDRGVSALKQAMGRGPVDVAVGAPNDSSPPEAGQVSYIENQIDPSSDTLGVRATLANADERLWPGQFVNVVVTLRMDPNAIIVPSEAVQQGQNGPYVFVITPESTVNVRNVEIGETIGGDTVIASGLKAGERVVTVGQLRLTPGAHVVMQPQNGQGATSEGPGS
jgi:membrane fusion protein, multidrug efflux system